jgi:putative hydrolase of the HAD superfamily
MRQAEMNHWQRVNEQQTSITPTGLLQEGFQLLERPASAEELLVALDGYAQAVNGWAIIFPDTVQTLTELRKRGYRLGLLSNTWWAAEWHNADLATHGLNSLPHPSTFLTVTTRLHVDPTECVMVGDRLIDDVSGAQGVGMRAIWKKTNYPWPQPEHITPTAIITELAELLPLLEQWQRKGSER